MPVLILGTATPSGLTVTYDYRNTIWGFVAFLALLLLSYFVLRWFSNRTIGSARHLRVIERLGVSKDVSLMIVEIGSKVIAVSATREGLNYLCDLSPRDIAGINEGRSEQLEDGSEDSTFLKRFWHNMRIQLGLLPKDTPPARPVEREETPPSPSPFAMALLRAQAEDDKSALMELLDKRGRSESDGDRLVNNPVPQFLDETPEVGSARDYNAAIESMKQMGKIDVPVIPVATSAAAAAYKTAPTPVRQEKPPRKEVQWDAPTVQQEAKPVSREDRVDELFDRISKRNSRYSKKD